MQSTPPRLQRALLEPEPAPAARAGGRGGAGVQPRAGRAGGRAGDAARAGARVGVRRPPGRGRQAPRPSRALPVRIRVFCSRVCCGRVCAGVCCRRATAACRTPAQTGPSRQSLHRHVSPPCAPPCVSLNSLAWPAAQGTTALEPSALTGTVLHGACAPVALLAGSEKAGGAGSGLPLAHQPGRDAAAVGGAQSGRPQVQAAVSGGRG